jgi:hypothetical protein
MDTFVRDQPLYDVETELKEALRAKAEQIRESTEKNDEEARETAQRSSPPTGGRQLGSQMLAEMKAASDQQLERLGLTEKEAPEEIRQPLQDMSLMHELVKDLNRFRELYQAQQNLAKQAKAYDRPGPLSREDQLALKDLAATERQISDELQAVEQQLREDSKAAAEKFPKASSSAEDFADRMADLRLQSLASQATDAMLAGRGDNGSQLATRLGAEMEKLFQKCDSQGTSMSEEMDQRLGLTYGMKPGSSFKQMMQTRKFGGGKPGNGFSTGASGPAGKSGFAIQADANPNVLGNETAISNSSKNQSTNSLSQAPAVEQPPTATLDKSRTLQGVNAVNRESGAVQGEGAIEQYSDLVERYFKAISK